MMLAEVGADLRTAITTEHLVTTSIALVVVGGASPCVAIFSGPRRLY